MAMSGSTLGNTIGQTLFNAIPASVKAHMTAAQCTETLQTLQCNWRMIAADIVAHIQQNAVVTVQAGIATGTVVPAPDPTKPWPGVTTSQGTGTIA